MGPLSQRRERVTKRGLEVFDTPATTSAEPADVSAPAATTQPQAPASAVRARACPEHRVTPAREPCAACLHPVDTFVALREAGFSFFFLPNG